jgi:hypothetical protein
MQQSAIIPIDRNMVFEGEQPIIAKFTLGSLEEIAKITTADIFLSDLEDKNDDGTPNTTSKEMLYLTVYGDMLTKENAKIRVLILIDQIVSLIFDDTDGLS